jgi:predicted  nucleic acid-binding Zn-ribbon protein
MSKQEEETKFIVQILKDIEHLGITDMAGYKNLMSIRNYSVDTRALARDLEIKVDNLSRQIVQQNQIIDSLRTQIANIQVKLYTGNKTSEG